MTDCIAVRGLVKEYGGFTLGPVDMEIPHGSIVGIIGNNGAGKTTLLKCITGAVIPASGTVDLGFERRNGDVGTVFDVCSFPRNMTAGDLSGIFRGMFSSWDERRFMGMLEGYGIDPSKKVKDYSRGMGMKLQVAVAMSHDARLMVLDEPTAGMDPAARDEFLDSLMAYIQDESHTVLVSSHITSDLERVADYIAFVRDGELILFDEKDRILEEHGILRCGNRAELLSAGGECIVSVRDGDYGSSALIRDKAGMREAYPELVVDDASLDDIFVYVMRGERP